MLLGGKGPEKGLFCWWDDQHRGQRPYYAPFKILSPASQRLFKILLSHREGSLRSSGGSRVEAYPFPPCRSSPLPRPKPTIFPAYLCSGLCRHQDGGPAGAGVGWGWEGNLGSQAFHTFPPAPLSPAPTWAYPCSLLLLPILAESAPPRHLDLHTCRGPGWEAAGAAAAERSAHTRRYPAPPGPPTAASAPHPAAPSPVSTIFYTKKDGGGTRRALGRCFRSVIASPRSSPQPTFCSSQTRAIVGRGGCGPCAASPRGSRTPSRAPRAAWAVPHQAQGTLPLLPVPYLLPLRLRFWARLWRARLQGHREQAARSERARADLTLQLGARVRGGGSREAFVTVGGPAPSPCRLLPARWRPAGWPAWHLSAAVFFLTAPAWALWLSLLCIFLGISLPAGEGQYLLRDLLAIPSSSLGTCLLLSSAPRICLLPLTVLSATNVVHFPSTKMCRKDVSERVQESGF